MQYFKSTYCLGNYSVLISEASAQNYMLQAQIFQYPLYWYLILILRRHKSTQKSEAHYYVCWKIHLVSVRLPSIPQTNKTITLIYSYDLLLCLRYSLIFVSIFLKKNKSDIKTYWSHYFVVKTAGGPSNIRKLPDVHPFQKHEGNFWTWRKCLLIPHTSSEKHIFTEELYH